MPDARHDHFLFSRFWILDVLRSAQMRAKEAVDTSSYRDKAAGQAAAGCWLARFRAALALWVGPRGPHGLTATPGFASRVTKNSIALRPHQARTEFDMIK